MGACDYLYTSSLPHNFMDQRAELIYVIEQMDSIDNHICQLNTLRLALYYRSCKLKNLLQPIYRLPMELLSYIFQQVVDMDYDPDPGFFCYQKRLGLAVALSSVSSLFHNVAHRTHELWMEVPLCTTHQIPTDKLSSLLQHCVTHTPRVSISVIDKLDEGEARSTMDVLFTPDVVQKVKAFELFESTNASNAWIEKLKCSSFHILDSLTIRNTKDVPNLDLGTLKTLTRLNIDGSYPDHSITLPPSLLWLNIANAVPRALFPLLLQCPHLVECVITQIIPIDTRGHSRLAEPLTLSHLNRLVFRVIDLTDTKWLSENLRLPSLEFLEISSIKQSQFTSVIPLCRSVSATITTLVIQMVSKTMDSDDLYQLCGLSFSKLKKLFIRFFFFQPLSRAIRAMALLDDANRNPRTRNLPVLESITLYYDGNLYQRSLLNLLEKWRIGEALSFHIQLNSKGGFYPGSREELQEELKSIVGGRRIEVTWGDLRW